MKAYALGRHSKWKDDGSLSFLLKIHLPIHDVIGRAKRIFSGHFNARFFREQLCYFEDMNYSESVEYLGDTPGDEQVKGFLEKTAVAI